MLYERNCNKNMKYVYGILSETLENSWAKELVVSFNSREKPERVNSEFTELKSKVKMKLKESDKFSFLILEDVKLAFGRQHFEMET